MFGNILLYYRKPDIPGLIAVCDIPVIPFDSDMDAQCVDQSNNEFERLIKEINTMDMSTYLPDDLKLNEIIKKIKTHEVFSLNDHLGADLK